jgi:hypothetical protein
MAEPLPSIDVTGEAKLLQSVRKNRTQKFSVQLPYGYIGPATSCMTRALGIRAPVK